MKHFALILIPIVVLISKFANSNNPPFDLNLHEQVKRIELFDEHVEGVYYNYWYGYILEENKLAIFSEGKSKEFRGFVSLNCKTGKVVYDGVTNFGYCLESDDEVDELIPEEVMKKCRQLICEK